LQVRRRHISGIVLTGIATSIRVESAARRERAWIRTHRRHRRLVMGVTVQQTVVAGQTATAVALQDEIGVRAAAQETAVAAQAQDTAVAQQTADATVQQTVVAQDTAVSVSQQVTVAQATANAPRDIPLGYWNHKCVVQSTLSDETITYTSDDTWADGMCTTALATSSTLVPFPTNDARPGYIQCAFIHLYGSGLWREFTNYTTPRVAMRRLPCAPQTGATRPVTVPASAAGPRNFENRGSTRSSYADHVPYFPSQPATVD
jgi:hypothetical protein